MHYGNVHIRLTMGALGEQGTKLFQGNCRQTMKKNRIPQNQTQILLLDSRDRVVGFKIVLCSASSEG